MKLSDPLPKDMIDVKDWEWDKRYRIPKALLSEFLNWARVMGYARNKLKTKESHWKQYLLKPERRKRELS